MGEIIVEYNKIANGIDDVARYLNLVPEKTIFMHSTSFDESNPKNIKRKAINKGRMLYSEILSYSSCLENGAKSAIAYYNKELLDFYDRIGFINLNNIIQVGVDKQIDYPFNSVSTMLNKSLKENKKLRKQLDGCTIVSSYIGSEDEENAKLINGKLLMKAKEQEKFNSKYEFRKLADKYNFKVLEGLTFKGVSNLEKKLQEFKKQININSNPSVWIKLENQSSGTGNLFIKGINEDISNIKEKLINISKKIYSEKYILEEMPLVIEIDANSLLNEVQIENIGVEAVISNNKVTILGGVSQLTKNGLYIGSEMTDKTYEFIEVAQECAKDAFIAQCKEGYRGFMVIDVLILKNSKTNKITAYNIDPNARFSAGTMLLRNIHNAEIENKKTIYGISYATAINLEDDILADLEQAMGNYKYNKNSNKLGIIPALLNDVTPLKNNKYYLKSIVLQTSYNKALENFKKFKDYYKNK